MHEHHKNTAILYHGGCPDGFGAAYAAWKKFSDTADYIPVRYAQPIPKNLEGKELYLVDFCYDKDTMKELLKTSKSLMVLDHHEGNREIIKSIPQHIYDVQHSGAALTWRHFHPGTQLPTFLQYVEDADLYRMVPDEERAIITYAYAQLFHFDVWDDLVRRIDDKTERAAMVERGKVYQEYFQIIARQLASGAELVMFEGHTCYLAAGEKMFITEMGHQLQEKLPPFALIVRAGATGLRVSLRGDGTVDVAKLAQKYGGNGHPASAAFSLPWGTPIPWTPITPESES